MHNSPICCVCVAHTLQTSAVGTVGIYSLNELAAVTALRMLNDFNVVRGVVLHIPVHHFTYKVRSICFLTRDIAGRVEIYFPRTDTVKLTVIILFSTACLRRGTDGLGERHSLPDAPAESNAINVFCSALLASPLIPYNKRVPLRTDQLGNDECRKQRHHL